MSLPTQRIFPKPQDTDAEDFNSYLNDLIFELETMYSDIVRNVNGNIRSSFDTQQSQFTPILKGDSAAGSFTYSAQYGWSRRSGLFTDVWFDITWSATTATGNLYLELPYKVALTSGKPFVGVCQPSNIAFGSGQTAVVINGESNSYKGNFWTIGSGNATAKLSVPSSGQVIGHIFYIGIDDE